MKWYDPLEKSLGIFICAAGVVLMVLGLCVAIPGWYVYTFSVVLLND